MDKNQLKIGFASLLLVCAQYSALKDLEMRDEKRVKGGFVPDCQIPSQLSLCGRDCTLSHSVCAGDMQIRTQPQRNSQTHFGLILF